MFQKVMARMGRVISLLRKYVNVLLNRSLYFLNHCSLQKGVFPSTWKSANVIPIVKKGDNTLPTNYRPVSLLNCLSNVFEKVVADRLITTETSITKPVGVFAKGFVYELVGGNY
jgi:hypothetical protein